MGVVFDETEPAGGFGESVQAHHEAFDFAAGGEEGVDLLFGGVEGEVADVEGRGIFELVFGLGRRLAELVVVAVAFASTLLGAVLVLWRK